MSETVYLNFSSGGVPTDAHAVTLESSDGTYGIRELSTGTVAVASGVSVTNPSTGRYEYVFSPDDGKVYEVSWKVYPTAVSSPQYVVQNVGPFGVIGVKAVAEKRGEVRQGQTTTFFLRLMNDSGDPTEASTILLRILDSSGGEVLGPSIPEKISEGFYALDWKVDSNQNTGTYQAVWTYEAEDSGTAVQEVTVSASGTNSGQSFLYSGRILEMRESLNYMLTHAQSIPVYKEEGIPDPTGKIYTFTFGKWNPGGKIRIYRNGKLLGNGFTIDATLGKVIFDAAQSDADLIQADYNFRWFGDLELDRFMSNALHFVNLHPATTNFSLQSVPDRFIPLILWGASVDAIRNLMMSLQFQEPQVVFGGPEGAQKAFGNLESLKKNYEEMYKDGLEKKKYGPYTGLMRMVTQPAFMLPGGRSRWYKYMFTGSH